jgi:hypothetical protein
MSWIECNNCEEMTDVCGGAVRLPYICGRCEKDAIEEDAPCDVPYNSGVPCQSALDSVDAHNADVLDQFDEDTKFIDDLRLQLEQANLNVQILEETVEDLETQLTDLRLDICNVVFRTHFTGDWL